MRLQTCDEIISTVFALRVKNCMQQQCGTIPPQAHPAKDAATTQVL
jgi:hypothetical protein